MKARYWLKYRLRRLLGTSQFDERFDAIENVLSRIEAQTVPGARRDISSQLPEKQVIGETEGVDYPTTMKITLSHLKNTFASRQLERAASDNGGFSNPLPISNFWEPNFTEPTVQIALRDYCKPGDVAFDVGANAGALTTVMSRHVGPRGIVCAFEASPRIIDKTHYNILQHGCNNVQLFYRAVYHTSHETVNIYPGNHLNDSIYNNLGVDNGVSYQVETLALDDFVAETGLMPRVIKMDIEGAEFDALRGSTSILNEGKPVLILEQSPLDMRCHDLLSKLGYICVDLANYRRILSVDDFDDGVCIANLLYVHSDEAQKDRYVNAGHPVQVALLTPDMFSYAANGSLALTNQLELPAGRYACITQFSASGTDNEVYAGIDTNRGRIHRYHTYTKMLGRVDKQDSQIG